MRKVPKAPSFHPTQVFAILLSTLPVAGMLQAQDTRSVTEPRFPPVCAVLRAPLRSTSSGPSIGPGISEQDAESGAETQAINAVIGRCSPGQAVELALGTSANLNSFLINPVTIPPDVSLIIDGGVTVYASRNPANYQIPAASATCGTVTPIIFNGICKPLLTFAGDSNNQANSGLYGYGILDGQGEMPMLSADPNVPPQSWWDLLIQKEHGNKSVNENSPVMVSAGNTKSAPLAGNFTMYKITVRNPPFHTVNWGGDGLTVWGVRIQAPWNVPNTDGFDIHGTNATLYDTIVSNGDDDIAFVSGDAPTSNMTVSRFTVYARDGITMLGNGDGAKAPISNLLIKDLSITGDLPSVAGTTVNGVTESELQSQYGVKSYAQALPNATGSVHGINVKYTNMNKTDTPPTTAAKITGITFQNVCMYDVEKALNIIPQSPIGSVLPTVDSISFENIHVLAPTSQFMNYTHGVPGTPGSGTYRVDFEGAPGSFRPQFTLTNVVFDDLPSGAGSSLSSVTATGNIISTTKNVYPAVFNMLPAPWMQQPSVFNSGNTTATVNDNAYDAMTETSASGPALACRESLPFITGELYASANGALATEQAADSRGLSIIAGGTVTLNAVVQPAMSQTTYFMPGSFGADPGLVAVGSPALTNSVRFYDGLRYIGSAELSANGTLATLEINGVAPGWHIYTAQYPKDSFYSTLNFGRVVVRAARLEE